MKARPARGRRWACFCKLPDGTRCPVHGYGVDLAETSTKFLAHYMAIHMERMGNA